MDSPQKIITELINTLSPKQRDVVIKRFGLKNGRRMTLESIGKEHGITRERVRQIEEDALNNLRKPQLISKLGDFFDAIHKHIAGHGHIKNEERLLEDDFNEIFAGQKATYPKSALYFLLTLGKPFEKISETKDWHGFWTTNKSMVPEVKNTLVSLHKKMEEHGKALDKKTLLDIAASLAKLKDLPDSEKALLSYINISKKIGSNVFDEYGLANWTEINPRGMKDKAYLVLKRLNKPIHFMQVAKEIEKAGLAKKSAHPQTVHNELIKDNRFVLVGRGTYALTDWGFIPGTIKDVISKTLKDAQGPLAKEDIVSAVLAQRQVKGNTIVLNLQNKKHFKKTGDGKYTLA